MWFSNMSPCFISIVHFSCKLQLSETWSFPFELNFGRTLPAVVLYHLIFRLLRSQILGIFYSAMDGCLFQVAITCNRLHWMFFTDWGYDKFNQSQIRSDSTGNSFADNLLRSFVTPFRHKRNWGACHWFSLVNLIPSIFWVSGISHF